MSILKPTIKGFTVSIMFLLFLSLTPIVAHAEAQDSIAEPSPSAATGAPALTEVPAPQQPTDITGIKKPTGAGANTYTYNSSTGLWENEYFTWNPVTQQTAPKKETEYSYNPQTEKWDTNDWKYDPAKGAYVSNIPVLKNDNAPSSNDKTSSTSKIGSNLPEAMQKNVDSDLNNNTSDKTKFDLFYDASISNRISNTARTGDVSGAYNTNVGAAMSGNALAINNLLNLLQATWGGLGGNIQTFNQNIYGNVTGDLYIDPKQLEGVRSDLNNNKLNITSSGNGKIVNDIDVSATSGSANLSNNTTGGTVSSGNANAVANVVNMINSMITSGQSFLGVLNIMGNLNGDILLPPEVLNALLASNGPNDAVSKRTSNDTSLNMSQVNNATIKNQVQASSTSGQALATNNSTAGNITSGNSLNNLTILNLTGQQVIGKNALLVFVNVLGKWVGMIMNAPVGSTSAAIGGGITQNTVKQDDLNISSRSNNIIENNITANAKSGNASAESNTRVGDVTSGDASASVNIANIINSSFSLSDWFGILFINVFGTWDGSFGVDTASGNIAVMNSSGQSTELPAVFHFGSKPHNNSNIAQTSTSQSRVYSPVDKTQDRTPTNEKDVRGVQVTNSATTVPPTLPGQSNSPQDETSSIGKLAIPSLGSALAGMGVLASEGIRNKKRRVAALQKIQG